MFSSTSFAGWKYADTNAETGSTHYVDFERIKKHDGYVYFWMLRDFSKPLLGDLSAKTYNQGDCKKFRLKYLSFSLHKGSMGGGEVSGTSNTPDKEWRYPSPDSSDEIILKTVCQYAR